MQNFSDIGPIVFEKNGNEQTDRQTDKEKYNIDDIRDPTILYIEILIT